MKHPFAQLTAVVPFMYVCRIEQLFADIQKHDDVIGSCAFCQVQMAFLPPVPPTWSDRLNLTPRPDTQDWNKLALIVSCGGKEISFALFSWGGRETWTYHSLRR